MAVHRRGRRRLMESARAAARGYTPAAGETAVGDDAERGANRRHKSAAFGASSGAEGVARLSVGLGAISENEDEEIFALAGQEARLLDVVSRCRDLPAGQPHEYERDVADGARCAVDSRRQLPRGARMGADAGHAAGGNALHYEHHETWPLTPEFTGGPKRSFGPSGGMWS